MEVKKKTSFTQILNEVLRIPDLTPLELKVLLYLATYKTPYPPYSVIMKHTGIKSQSSVRKAIKGLQEKGYLKILRQGYSIPGHSKANQYVVLNTKLSNPKRKKESLMDKIVGIFVENPDAEVAKKRIKELVRMIDLDSRRKRFLGDFPEGRDDHVSLTELRRLVDKAYILPSGSLPQKIRDLYLSKSSDGCIPDDSISYIFEKLEGVSEQNCYRVQWKFAYDLIFIVYGPELKPRSRNKNKRRQEIDF